MAREYELTISAVLGRGTADVLAPWVVQAQRAKAQIDAILSAPPKTAARAGKDENAQRVAEAKKAAAELERIRERENNQILKDVEKRLSQEERAAERAAKHVAAIKERYLREEQRRGEKADAEQANRRQKIASDSFSNMRRVASAATRVAGELTSGFGVSFDLSSAMQRGAGLDETARRTTISGKGALGQNATEADVQSTVAAIKKAGDESKQSYGAMAAGLEDFVSKSSDLATGTKYLADFGRIARATGTDVNELISAAGDISKTLEDTPDKGEKLLEIMTLVATQSAKGSVEVKDFAKYMGRVTAGAFKFEGTRAENIGILSGLTQVAMKGGAAGPREATNAAQAFSNDLTKGAALKRFEAAGIDVFANKEKTELRSPQKIITDFLRQSKGDLSQLSNLFQNEGSRRVVTGFSQAYTAAGGGEKGIAAVDAEFKKFAESMSSKDVKERFDLSAGGRTAKGVEFQNKLDKLADSLSAKVLPALESLEEPALKVAEGLSGIVVWAASNPFASIGIAIGASITASIAKAAIGDAIGKAIAGATLKGGLTLTATAVALYATKSIIDAYQRNEKNDKDIEAAKGAAVEAVKRGAATPEERQKIEQTAKDLDKRTSNAARETTRFAGVNPLEAIGGAVRDVLFGERDLTDIAGGQMDNVGGRTAGLVKDQAKLAADKVTIDNMPTAEAIGSATAAALAPLINGAVPAAPTGGTVPQ